MSIKNKISSRKAINTIIFTKYKLNSECLSYLIESKSEIKILDCADTPHRLLEKVLKYKPDVVLFCLTEEDPEIIELLSKLFEAAPSTKVLVLCDITSSLDQTKIIQQGATGIVGTHQREEVLVRAIRQVSEGEVWFSQKLIAQLFGSKNGHNNAQNGTHKDQSLTGREVEVVQAIALGLNNKEISKKLFISEATVRHHLSSIYSKLYIEDRLNLVIYAYQNNFVPPSKKK